MATVAQQKYTVLMERNDGNNHVAMWYWRSPPVRVTIEVATPDESFTLYPPSADVMEWYNHPYAYRRENGDANR